MKKNLAHRRLKKTRSPAFSLVLSLAIMSMILIMVLSLAAFLTIELRSSSAFTKQMLARQNTLTGARIVLGKLQLLAGPDRRISAPGIFAIESAETRRSADESILPNSQWVGIWSTIDKDSPNASSTERPFYVGYHEEIGKLGRNAFLSDTRNRNGVYRRPDVLEWLVTQVPNQTYTPQTTPESNWVTMLSYKNTEGLDSTVTVPYLGFNEEGIVTQGQIGATGGFAYWASDEGMKARINLRDPRKEIDPQGNPQEGYYRLLGPAANNIKLVQNPADKTKPYTTFDTVDINNRLREIVTLQTAAFLDFGGTAVERARNLKQNFLDFTDVSSGVLASTARGGLLSDLTAYLHSTNGTIADDGTTSPVRPGLKKGYESRLITSAKHENSAPTFEALKKWYDAPLPVNHGSKIDLANHYPMQINIPNSQKEDALKIINIDGGWDVGDYSWPRMKKFLDQEKGAESYAGKNDGNLPFSPVVVEIRIGYDFAANYENMDEPPSGGIPSDKNIKCYIFPQVALWNPYSVPITVSKTSNILYAVHVYWMTILRLQLGTNIFTYTTRQYNQSGTGNAGHMAFLPIPKGAALWRGAIGDEGAENGGGFASGNYGDFFNFHLDPSHDIPPGEVLVYRADYNPLIIQGYTNTGYRRYLRHSQINNANRRDNVNLLSPKPQLPDQATRVGNWVFQHTGNGGHYIKEGTLGAAFYKQPYRILEYTYDVDSEGAASVFTYPGAVFKMYHTGLPEDGDFRRNPMHMPTLQRLNMTPGGEAPYGQSSQTVLPENHAVYDTSYWILGTDNHDSDAFTTHNRLENRRKVAPPPSGFQVAYRLLRFDETDENEITIAGQSRFGPNGEASSVSPIANFNVRSPMVMRIPNAYYDSKSPAGSGPGKYYGNAGWARNLATGPYIIEWAKPRLWADDHEPFVEDGFTKGAPFTKWGRNGSLAKKQGKVILFDFPARGTNATATGPGEALALTSLADFRFAWLSPFLWHPTYVVGSSLMDPFSDPERTVNKRLYEKYGLDLWPQQDAQFKGRGGHSKLLGGMNSTDILLYDISFEVNHNLFDNYFLSTLLKGTETGKSVWNGTEALPNARLKLHKSVKPNSVAFNQAMGSANEMYHRMAGILVNEGAFNVNSTSVEAWVAFLSSTLDVPRPTKAGSSGGSGVHFSKFLTPELNGVSKTPRLADKEMYGSYRILTQAEIRTLAEKVVEEVKFRGPFLSLSDFVNRRLIGNSQQTFTGDQVMALQGTLEAAILNANINDTNDTNAVSDIENLKKGMDDAYVAAFPKRKTQNLAGHLTQMEILSALGPAMTARSDTFKIRVYGDTRLPTSTEPEAKAYLELVVQRQPQFYDTSDPAHTPVTVATDDSNSVVRENDTLKAANRQFGRRFEIVSLRWLSANEL